MTDGTIAISQRAGNGKGSSHRIVQIISRKAESDETPVWFLANAQETQKRAFERFAPFCG
jgi:hypothetical protein